MAENVGSIEYDARINTSNFTSDAKKVETTASNLADSLDSSVKKNETSYAKLGAIIGVVSGIVQTVATRAINGISDSISLAIKRVDTLNNAQRTFENMGFSAANTGKAMDGLKKSILGLPTSLDEAVTGLQLIAASTNDIGKSQKIFTSLNNAIIGFGGSSESVTGAVIQLSQAFSNGKIDAQTWNSLIQNGLGPVLNALARQLGVTTGQLKESLSDGTISVTQFQDSLIDLNENGGGGLKSLTKIAKDATGGIGTGFENMQTAISRGIASIIQAVGSKNISSIIAGIGTGFETASKAIVKGIGFIKSFFGFIKDNQTTITNLAIVITTLLLPAIIKIGIQSAISFGLYLAGLASTVIATSVAAVQMAASWLLAMGPIGLIVAAVVGLTVLIIANWETVKGWFTSFWGWLQNAASSAVNTVIGIFSGIVNFFKGAGSWLLDAGKNVVTGLINGIKGMGNALWGGISEVSSKIGSFFKNAGNWLWDAGKNLIEGFINGIKSKFNDVKSTLGDLTSKLTSWKGPASLDKVILKQSGQMVIGGFINGLESMYGSVHRSLGGLTNSIGAPAISSPTASMGGLDAIDSARSSGSSNSSVSINVNMSGIMARSKSDERDIAKSLVRRINEELSAKGQPVIAGGVV